MSTVPASAQRQGELRPLLGVLGGMGPLATVDFLGKLVAATLARSDQDHLPMIVSNDPRIPDRSEAMLHGQEDVVLVELQARICQLITAGATAIAIPCNTAHHWVARLEIPNEVPVLHIADAAIELLRETARPGSSVAVLATPATLTINMYQARLSAAGYRALVPPRDVVYGSLLPAIRAVKGGDARSAEDRLTGTMRWMDVAGVEACLLACTELPLARSWNNGAEPSAIDTTRALVRACLRWWESQSQSTAIEAA